eukprot:4615938-Amphidinium_carterae.1
MVERTDRKGDLKKPPISRPRLKIQGGPSRSQTTSPKFNGKPSWRCVFSFNSTTHMSSLKQVEYYHHTFIHCSIGCVNESI